MSYEPRFTITALLVRRIEEITALREKILNASIQVPWMSSLQKDARIRNTHSSTAIEGNPLTLEEVRRLEEGQDIEPTPERSKKEIFNYFAGLRYIEKNASIPKITTKHLIKLHSLMAAGVMDQGTHGSYRHIAVRVGPHIPPPACDVPRLMSELLDWWNQQSSPWSPVISCAILHYRFEDIHPFADGNGRVGRALALWELYRRGFDTHHVFSIDEFYWEDRLRYYRSLAQIQSTAGDLSPWIEYCAEGIQQTLERVWRRVQKLSASSRSSKLVLRPKQEKLLDLLRDHNTLAPAEIWKLLKISKQGALDLIKPLIAAGLIRRIGTKKSGKYILS